MSRYSEPEITDDSSGADSYDESAIDSYEDLELGDSVIEESDCELRTNQQFNKEKNKRKSIIFGQIASDDEDPEDFDSSQKNDSVPKISPKETKKNIIDLDSDSDIEISKTKRYSGKTKKPVIDSESENDSSSDEVKSNSTKKNNIVNNSRLSKSTSKKTSMSNVQSSNETSANSKRTTNSSNSSLFKTTKESSDNSKRTSILNSSTQRLSKNTRTSMQKVQSAKVQNIDESMISEDESGGESDEGEDDSKNIEGSDESSDQSSENIEGSDESSDQSLHSIDFSEPQVGDRSKRISNIFDQPRGIILNSTVIGDTGNFPNSQLLEQSLMKKKLQENDPMLTPRTVKKIIPSRSPSPSVEEITTSSSDVIDISSDVSGLATTRVPPVKNIRNSSSNKTRQTTLDGMFIPKPHTPPTVLNTAPIREMQVSPSEWQTQKSKVQRIEADLAKSNNIMRTINLSLLPDKGRLLQEKKENLEKELNYEQERLMHMTISKPDRPPLLQRNSSEHKNIAWEDIQAGVSAVQPKTTGKQAMATYNAQKALTVDRLQQLHGSLEKCPKEDTLEEDPKGLKVDLMPHQKRALAWLMFREKQKPSGGILADDMGLGKTLTMISLMLKMNETEKMVDSSSEDENENENRPKTRFNGGTLVVCPASLLNQWSGELENRAKRGLASFLVYHGPKREKRAKVLASYDMVITTYAIAQNENPNGVMFRVKWRRIVLDEAHQIRNYKCLTSVAVCVLSAKSRWALTGTPIHNKELDMYALLKFLRCSPFDDLMVWKRWVANKSAGGVERLHTVISSLMLRRTKQELMAKGALNCLPERKWELITIELQKKESEVYHKVNLFSKTLFAQYLHQRAQKNQDIYDANYLKNPAIGNANGPNGEFFKMRDKLLKMNKIQDISQHHILVLLLRLRQICDHPILIQSMLDENCEDIGSEEDKSGLNLLDQLSKLNLEDDEAFQMNQSAGGNISTGESGERGLKEAAKGFLNPSNPVFSDDYESTKIKVLLDHLKEHVIEQGDKAIVVSQFPSFLRIIGSFLKKSGISFDQLDGSIPVHKRMAMVDSFNDPKHKMQVLLLSLTAGGVGLNLIGANHLYLLDLHWNPQLENQAQDRIYRVGQKKPVFVYKMIATDTIEERIKMLQDKKLETAEAMINGTKQVISSKLTLNDLKMLFGM